jgi:hypothetical protein
MFTGSAFRAEDAYFLKKLRRLERKGFGDFEKNRPSDLPPSFHIDTP